jgi:hypothetical protein
MAGVRPITPLRWEASRKALRSTFYEHTLHGLLTEKPDVMLLFCENDAK